MTDISSKKRGRKARLWLLAFGFVILILTVLILIGWSNRKDLAQRYFADWCVERALECRGEFAQLDLDRILIEGLAVQSRGETPFEAKSVELALTWPAFLKPEITRIGVVSPNLRGEVANGEPGLYGLEELFSTSSNAADQNSDAQIPELNIENGTLVLATDAGDISGTFEVKGKPLQSGTAMLHVNPNRLKRGDAEIAWSKGDVALAFQDGAVVGDIDFAIETAKLDSLSLTNASLTGKLAEHDANLTFEMNGQASSFEAVNVKGEEIVLQASGALTRLQDFDLETLKQAISHVTFVAEGETISSGELEVSQVEISSDLNQTEVGLSGPVAANIRGLNLPQGSIDDLAAVGEVVLGPGRDPAYEYKGALILKDAAVATRERSRLLASLKIPEPFDAHGAQLRATLSKAMAGFEVGLDVDASYRADAWSLVARRATLLKSESGLMFTINPFTHQPWLRADQDMVDVSGDISLAGGQGLPNLSGRLDEFRLHETGVSVALGKLSLAPWRASARTLSGKMESLELDYGARLQAVANGEINLSGELPGVTLGLTRIIGHVSAVEAVEGWRVQTHNNSCVGFSSESIAAGTLRFDEMALSLCPVDGRFVRQENGQSVGRIDMGDLSLPFTTGDARGALDIEEASLEWFAGESFRLLLNGKGFHLPLQFTEDTLVIDGDAPEVTFALDGGPAQIQAALWETRFGGTMVPANVVSSTFSFNGVTTKAGINGEMEAGRVRISDLGSNPAYQPLIAELKATMDNGVVAMTGPIRSEARGVVIANTEMDLHLGDFTGEAKVRMVPLSFAKGGLQPVHLSELLRGVLTNARGGLTGGADFQINKGALSGTGHVDLNNLILDTLSVGTISGVNGRIAFSDILARTTYPSQKLTIDYMDPGVPLSDGEVVLQIVEGTTTKLESAGWPFAGGRLEVLPVTLAPGEDTRLITMQAQELELEQLIEVFKVPDLFASGTVSGDFPIEIDGANILVRQAELIADEKGGRLSYTGSATDVAQGQNEYADGAFEALEDFDFEVMKIGADGNLIGNMVLSADILGKSDEAFDGRKIKFGLTFTSDLSQVLQAITATESNNYVAESAVLLQLREQANEKQE